MIDWIIYSVLIGTGATVLFDLWSLLLEKMFNMPPLNWQMVGRWIGLMREGKFYHQKISQSKAVKNELLIGWLTHYLIGIIFAGIFLLIHKVSFSLLTVSFLSCITFGIVTVVFPFFIMQPCMGLGIAASKTPKPHVARIRSLINHMVFGVGLYVATLTCVTVNQSFF
ncbi:DUF2938 domain-containing protein [Thalassotalea sp. 1_MG-2023]|uniref:DUF2938 domain-containing protein n=1 Tax=Thalassotalea sp. 1_MG-2023 TaxID=3062680 RepID=UPI0026E27C95|nr:DUF2938 domain-containing protein [Thalassotalea sp. 1_MG-2023]MDO6428753.1 DUF2938 domain-containing protein [Thalassotalea sp. 1_MG-2023]